MKVRELLELLEDINPEYEVVLSKDGEGNSYSPASVWSVCQYVPDSTWSGTIRDLIDSEEDGLDEDQMAEDGLCLAEDLNALVLWPVN